MSQTSVSAGGQAAAVAGQIGCDPQECDIKSGVNEASAQMPFGYGVRLGSGERGYLLATGFSGSVPVAGVNCFGYNHAPAGSADANGNFQGDMGGSGLLQNSSLDVMRRGSVWLPVESTITKGHGLWCRGVATGSLTAGSWLGAARGAAGPLGASYHVDCSKQGMFVTGVYTAADGTTSIALAEVDFVNSPF